MPNHVTTKCTVFGDPTDIVFFAESTFTENTEANPPYVFFDFQKIIPMPDFVPQEDGRLGLEDILTVIWGGSHCAQIWESLRRNDSENVLGPWKGTAFFDDGEIERRLESWRPGITAEARRMARCFGETGFKGWYDWSIANWGTKWNAYSFEKISDDPFVFRFDTAWDFPTPVFRAAAKKFPDLRFHCVTFDEGWNFAGSGWFNPKPGEPPFMKCGATDDLYVAVYDRLPEQDEADNESSLACAP